MTEHFTQCTFFLSAHGTHAKMDRILGHKANVNECDRTERHYRVPFSSDSEITLINNRKRTGNNTYFREGVSRKDF